MDFLGQKKLRKFGFNQEFQENLEFQEFQAKTATNFSFFLGKNLEFSHF